MDWPLSETQTILVAGIVLGASIGGLIGAAFGWDYGYVKGERDERRRWQVEQQAKLYDGLGEVL